MLLRMLSSCVKMGHHQANKSKAVPGNSRIFGYKWTISAYFSITECTFEDMCKAFGIPELRRKAHFCAVSSTSGTATEVTAFSIITDYQKGIKYPIADFEITPDVAIVDPELAETMPKKLVAHTGMDAMTHAIEAYVSTANSDYTDPLAIHAIEMIMKQLVPSYNGDMTARDHMHDAQCLAGMAFSNALLGIVHSMAHKTGAIFADYGAHIIHGAANAMYLPKVIAFNAKDTTAKKRYGVIVDYMGIADKADSDDVKVEKLIAFLRGMNDQLNIPHCIKNYGAEPHVPCHRALAVCAEDGGGGRDCSEVLIQLAAVQSALQSTGKVILQDHLRHCIVEAVQEGDTEAIDELCKAIDRYMK